MHSRSLQSRALLLGVAALTVILLAAACSSSSSDDAADTPDEIEAVPEESTTTSTTPEADAGTDDSDGSTVDPQAIPTIDVEAALAGIDTETPPDPEFCVLSDYLDSDEWSADFEVAIGGGDAGQEAIEALSDHFDRMYEVAPDDLKDDVEKVADTILNYLDAVAEAVDTDDFVNATELQEAFAEIQDSGARLGAYDMVVCGNVEPGEGDL